jgi:hypothetical protein
MATGVIMALAGRGGRVAAARKNAAGHEGAIAHVRQNQTDLFCNAMPFAGKSPRDGGESAPAPSK